MLVLINSAGGAIVLDASLAGGGCATESMVARVSNLGLLYSMSTGGSACVCSCSCWRNEIELYEFALMLRRFVHRLCKVRVVVGDALPSEDTLSMDSLPGAVEKRLSVASMA